MRAHLLREALAAGLCLTALTAVIHAGAGTARAEPTPLPPADGPLETNRSWEVLPAAATPRARLALAARLLGTWHLSLAGVEIDAARLGRIAAAPESEPFVRALREGIGRAVDVEDFLLFLDDVLAAAPRGLRGHDVFLTAGRARGAGILLHPDDVFAKRPRRYGTRGPLDLDRPRPQQSYPPAADGEPLGPNWTMRFQNPASEPERIEALRRLRPSYAARIESLVRQLRAQGAEVYLTSTVRRPERGYLMWGAFLLSRTKTSEEVSRTVGRLSRANREWGISVPVSWQDPSGWRATIEAAREMADTYGVVYATEEGARGSNHYSGVAADLVAVGLPRELEVRAPDGAVTTFDLREPEQPRDLSLTPEIIDWIETHFEMRKLESDYPHWDDARDVGGD